MSKAANIEDPGIPLEPGSLVGDLGFPATTLNGTAKIWLQNELIGTKRLEDVRVRGMLTTFPQSDRVKLRIDSIRGRKIVISQTSGDGCLDAVTGLLDLYVTLNVRSLFSGVINITISTEKTITPPRARSVSGQRRDPNGNITLVGDAPIVGPPGRTHCWLQVDGNLPTEAVT